MKLLVSCIPYDGGKSGISTYVREVVSALAAQGHELTLLLEPEEGGRRRGRPQDHAGDAEECGRPQDHAGGAEEGGATGRAFPPVGAKLRFAPRWTRRAPFSMLWHLCFLPLLVFRHRREFDGFFVCAANRRVCAFHPLPTVATVHDLANFRIPGKYSRARMFYLARVLPFFAKRADRLVAVSESTKADMVRFWRCAPDKISVLYEGLEKEGAAAEARLAAAGDERSLAAGGTILYVSRIEHPGKNHVRLIEAYSRLPRSLAEAHPLVLAGAPWKDADAVFRAAERSRHRDLIRFAGFVSDAELERLWAGAGFYVFPSLFEGFGLSLAEAMARGVPCACSENGSLGEIAGDAAVKFDPESVESIRAALESLLEESPAERAARVARGMERAKLFSWSGHASGIVRAFREAGESRK